MRRACAVGCLALAGIFVAGPALARGRGLRVAATDERPELDGVPTEWHADFRELTSVVSGSTPKERDLSGKVALLYDDEHLYVAADVTDERLVAGGDHVELLLGIPGGSVERIRLYPGDTASVRGVAKLPSGQVVLGARVVEAPTATGWSLEASIPWARIPKSDRIRVGYRGALVVHDADASTAVEASLATTDSLAYGMLPALSLEPELSLGAGLLRERGLTMPPTVNVLADVLGDARLERVLVYESLLVVLGPGVRGGREYFFRDLGPNSIVRVELEDRDGDRKADVVVHERLADEEWVRVLAFAAGSEVPHVASESRAGGSTRSSPSALDRGTSAEMPHAAHAPAASVREGMPRAVAGVRDTLNGAVLLETKKPAGPDADRVYRLYRERRNVDGPPRFDLTADFGDDARAERLVVHGADLVIFGPGFRDGRSFAAMTLDGDGSAIDTVIARDVDGDGKADVVVTAVVSGRKTTAAYALRGGQFVRLPDAR